MLCPSCNTENVDGAGRCSACNESLLPFSAEIETGIDAHSRTRAGEAENLIGLMYNSIASCFIGFKMRREISKALGPKSANSDMLSISTWMKIRNDEAKLADDKPPRR